VRRRHDDCSLVINGSEVVWYGQSELLARALLREWREERTRVKVT
jgi:hypothetical protein